LVNEPVTPCSVPLRSPSITCPSSPLPSVPFACVASPSSSICACVSFAQPSGAMPPIEPAVPSLIDASGTSGDAVVSAASAAADDEEGSISSVECAFPPTDLCVMSAATTRNSAVPTTTTALCANIEPEPAGRSAAGSGAVP
jgi:hypothetical protein